MIDTRNASAIASSKIKGGGIETASCYPRWKRINRPKDSGPPRYYYLLESYSKVINHQYIELMPTKWVYLWHLRNEKFLLL
jgi:hypothetical protein